MISKHNFFPTLYWISKTVNLGQGLPMTQYIDKPITAHAYHHMILNFSIDVLNVAKQ